MIQLLNSLPNGIWNTSKVRNVTTISTDVAITFLQIGFTSFIGHANFAEILTSQTGIEIPVNRSQADLGSDILAALVTTPRRLAEGEKWTEEEILAMPIQWVLVM